MVDHFRILAQDSNSSARRAQLTTRHGTIQTPIFMPVGTQATVKAMTPRQVNEAGAQIILGNTYHLNLRPGSDLIREMGGLHRFMSWDKPILTDSGGFQVFSLAKRRTLTDEGVIFSSHLDGRKVYLTPQECFRIQSNLGSDIAMVLDECPPWPCERVACQQAVERTLRWAKDFRNCAEESGFLAAGHHVFGIVQGSTFEDLRRQCALELAEMNFPGYAIGGVSVGEPEPEMLAQVAMTTPHVPEDKPRYVMGVGTPSQLLKMIALGADLFDCVIPTRLARHGTAFTPDGPINLRNEKFKKDERPLVEGMDNEACKYFSRAYLRHLVISQEILGCTLLSIHNTHFFLDLMAQARAHLEAGDYTSWASQWCARYEGASAQSDFFVSKPLEVI